MNGNRGQVNGAIKKAQRDKDSYLLCDLYSKTIHPKNLNPHRNMQMLARLSIQFYRFNKENEEGIM